MNRRCSGQHCYSNKHPLHPRASPQQGLIVKIPRGDVKHVHPFFFRSHQNTKCNSLQVHRVEPLSLVDYFQGVGEGLLAVDPPPSQFSSLNTDRALLQSTSLSHILLQIEQNCVQMAERSHWTLREGAGDSTPSFCEGMSTVN